MKRHYIAGLLILILAGATARPGEDTPDTGKLEALDELTAQWMQLRTTIAREKQDWKEQHRHVNSEIDLLQKRVTDLTSQINDLTERTEAADKDRTELVARSGQLKAVVSRLRDVFSHAESELRKWRARIPPGLRATLTTRFDALPESEKEAAALALGRRARTIVALYTEIESLQNGIHNTRETLEASKGRRRQMDVLYLGLARGFAVSRDKTWAAVGNPSEKGWTWQPAPESAAAIRQAIDIYSRQETARLIRLPLDVSDGRTK